MNLMQNYNRLRRKYRITIEHKIMVPFVLIGILIFGCFCLILYRTESEIMMETKLHDARQTARRLCYDMEQERNEPGARERLLEKCEQLYAQSGLRIYDESESQIFGGEPREQELVLLDEKATVWGWRMVFSIEEGLLRETFIEEQRYMILAFVAMLLILVQSSVFIAYHIAGPLRRLGAVCTRVSRFADGSETEDKNMSALLPSDAFLAEQSGRQDEIGQLAAAFDTMMHALQRYLEELTSVKALNETIVSNLPLGVAVYNKDAEIIFLNERARGLLALEERDPETKLTLGELLRRMVLRDDILPKSVQLEDDSLRRHSYEIGVWNMREQESSLCTIDDVTYQKHMEEKISHDEKLAYTGELAATVAHEARNPLAGIRTGLQVILPQIAGDRDRLMCREMIREVDRVNLLIENMLNLSRERESRRAPVSLREVFDELSLLYSKIAENKGICFSVEAQDELQIVADVKELKQIFINLINNAMKAADVGGHISLRAHRSGERIRILVSDDGSGMDEKTLESLRRGRTDGRYGMAIVKRLLAQNGGELTIDSSPGQGTTVSLSFRGLASRVDEQR